MKMTAGEDILGGSRGRLLQYRVGAKVRKTPARRRRRPPGRRRRRPRVAAAAAGKNAREAAQVPADERSRLFYLGSAME
jgi:hypothetical protein